MDAIAVMTTVAAAVSVAELEEETAAPNFLRAAAAAATGLCRQIPHVDTSACRCS